MAFRSIRLALIATFVAGLAAGAQPSSHSAGVVGVVIETDRGLVDVALDSARAPKTVSNFLAYVDAGAYTNGVFHRAVTLANQPTNKIRIQVIQGGMDPSRPALFAPIALERTTTTGLRHHDGTISMARDGPNTATSDFFICIGEQPALDFGGQRNPDGQGFAAFGQVTHGMEVVRMIQEAPATGQTLMPPIHILRIHRAVAR